MKKVYKIFDQRLSRIENILNHFKEQLDNGDKLQQEKLLTIQEAEAFLRLSVPTIYSKVSKCELPVMKRGKRLYFSTEELLAYVKAGRKKTNKEIESEASQNLTIKQRRMR